MWWTPMGWSRHSFQHPHRSCRVQYRPALVFSWLIQGGHLTHAEPSWAFFWNIWTSQEVGRTHSGQSETMWAASVWPHGCCWGWPFYPGRKRGKYCLEVEKIQWSPGVCAKTADVSGEILPPCEESCTGLSRPKKSKLLWNLRKLLLLNSNVIYMCIYLHIPICLLLSIC